MPDSIQREEYDFSGISKEHLSAAIWYEYGRECQAAVKEADSIRSQFAEGQGKTTHVILSPPCQSPLYEHMVLRLAMCEGFPSVPWQKLGTKEQEGVLKAIHAQPDYLLYKLTFQNPPLTFNTHMPDGTTLGEWKRKIIESHPQRPEDQPIGFFSVTLQYGHDTLIREFKKWLRHFEGKPMIEYPPEQKPKQPAKRGRKNHRDYLRSLGALRLRFCCTSFDEARTLLKPQALYQDRRSFNRACQKAVAYYRNLFLALDPQHLYPTHFKPSWGGVAEKK